MFEILSFRKAGNFVLYTKITIIYYSLWLCLQSQNILLTINRCFFQYDRILFDLWKCDCQSLINIQKIFTVNILIKKDITCFVFKDGKTVIKKVSEWCNF